MIIELRTYDIVAGKTGQYLDWYREFGIAVQIEHLGCLLGYYTTEIGDLNQVIHLWRYEDLAERSGRRAKLFADPRWLEFYNRAISLIIKQRSAILTSIPMLVPQPATLQGHMPGVS